MFNQSKYLKKLKKQKQSNPGNKESYVPMPRPRSTVFSSKKDYSRQQEKLNLKKYTEAF